MAEERRLATEQHYPDPIHDTLQNTHDAYNAGARYVLSLIKAGKKVRPQQYLCEKISSALLQHPFT